MGRVVGVVGRDPAVDGGGGGWERDGGGHLNREAPIRPHGPPGRRARMGRGETHGSPRPLNNSGVIIFVRMKRIYSLALIPGVGDMCVLWGCCVVCMVWVVRRVAKRKIDVV